MSNIFWENMKKDVKDFVNTCRIGQQCKYLPSKPARLLHPILSPTSIWEDIAMDFILKLPTYQGNTVIMVVIDCCSKYAHFGMLPSHFSANKAAEILTNIVCKLHGFPHNIISDRDPIFLSKFWRTLFHLHGTQLRMSTAYHPQSDGQSKVLNRYLAISTCFCSWQTFFMG